MWLLAYADEFHDLPYDAVTNPCGTGFWIGVAIVGLVVIVAAVEVLRKKE